MISEIRSRRSLHHTLRESQHEIEVNFGDAAQLSEFLRTSDVTMLLAVVDTKVPRQLVERVLKAIRCTGILVSQYDCPGGEAIKTLDQVQDLLLRADEIGLLRRSGCFVAIGGGAVCDMTGLAASLWLRGSAYSLVPTTLTAMADASIGSKTAVNLGKAKNAIGSFWCPNAVVIDLSFVASVSPAAFRADTAEILKTALIASDGGEFLDAFEQAACLLHRGPPFAIQDTDTLRGLISRAIEVKLGYVTSDWQEDCLARPLNLGHSIGNPLSADSGLPHGTAVAVGILAAMRVGLHRGITSPEFVGRIERLVSNIGMIQGTDQCHWSHRQALDRVRQTTVVRGGFLREPIPSSPGQVEIVDDVSPEELVEQAKCHIRLKG